MNKKALVPPSTDHTPVAGVLNTMSPPSESTPVHPPQALFSRLFGTAVQLPGPNDCTHCRSCMSAFTDSIGMPLHLTRMVVCPHCGDKRCPKAQDHTKRCPLS